MNLINFNSDSLNDVFRIVALFSTKLKFSNSSKLNTYNFHLSNLSLIFFYSMKIVNKKVINNPIQNYPIPKYDVTYKLVIDIIKILNIKQSKTKGMSVSNFTS